MIKKFLEKLKVRKVVWRIWNDIKRNYVGITGTIVIKEDGKSMYIKEHAVKEDPISYPAIYRPALEEFMERKGFFIYKRLDCTYLYYYNF